MDYAKYTYLKFAELEDDIANDNSINSIEFEHSAINTDVTESRKFDAGTMFIYGKVNFQNKILLSVLSKTQAKIELLVDDIVIASEIRTLEVGQTAILLLKSFNTNHNGTINVSVKITVLDEGKTVKVLSNMLSAWGYIKEDYAVNECSMQVLPIGQNLIISYVQDGEIYCLTTAAIKNEFVKDDFTYVANGISHCFAEHKTSGEIYFFRVDYNGNLFCSKFAPTLNEQLIDTNVSCVYAKKCASSYAEDILICYIKNNKPMYCTMTGNSIASSGTLDAPKDKYKSVYIAESYVDRMFVVCTTKKDKNYILFTQKDTNLSMFYVSVNANIAFFTQKYLYINNKSDFFEQINADISFNLSKYLNSYQDLLSNRLCETVHSNFAFLSSTYTIDLNPEINYYMSYVQAVQYTYNPHRITFTGDCADWTFASFDVNGDGHLIDNGNLLSKWPFNKIKPCLIKNGEVVCYLNPNNYALKEDGTAADITSGEYDVMIQFPKMYVKFEEDWDGITAYYNTRRANASISVSNKPKAGYSCLSHTKNGVEYDYVYVSAYKTNIDNGVAYCCSGKRPLSDVNHKDFVTNFANYKSSCYTTFSYHFLTYLRILNMLLIGEQYGANMFGYGWLSNQAPTANQLPLTGTMDTSGMYNCIKAPNDTTNQYAAPANAAYHNKIFGLEDLFGSAKTYMDGILFTADKKYLVIDPTNTNSYVNFDGTGYNQYGFNFSGNYLNGWVTLYSVNNSYGILPVNYVATHATGRTYYGVKTKVYKPDRYTSSDGTGSFSNMIFTIGGSYTTYCGLEMWADLDYSLTDNKHNERLMCFPESKRSN